MWDFFVAPLKSQKLSSQIILYPGKWNIMDALWATVLLSFCILLGNSRGLLWDLVYFSWIQYENVHLHFYLQFIMLIFYFPFFNGHFYKVNEKQKLLLRLRSYFILLLGKSWMWFTSQTNWNRFWLVSSLVTPKLWDGVKRNNQINIYIKVIYVVSCLSTKSQAQAGGFLSEVSICSWIFYFSCISSRCFTHWPFYSCFHDNLRHVYCKNVFTSSRSKILGLVSCDSFCFFVLNGTE